MPQALNLLLALLCGLAASTAVPPAAAQAHQHGLVLLDIAIEPNTLSLRLQAPQDSLLGHERRPRSAAEQQAAAALRKRLTAAATLWPLPAALGCKPAGVEIDAPLLQASAPPAASNTGSAEAHAEVEASWRFDCRSTAALRSLDLGPLLDAFARIQRVDAQVAGPAGQFKTGLRRPARVLGWGR